MRRFCRAVTVAVSGSRSVQFRGALLLFSSLISKVKAKGPDLASMVSENKRHKSQGIQSKGMSFCFLKKCVETRELFLLSHVVSSMILHPFLVLEPVRDSPEAQLLQVGTLSAYPTQRFTIHASKPSSVLAPGSSGSLESQSSNSPHASLFNC